MWQPTVKCVCVLFFPPAELKNDREGENKEGRRKQWNRLRVLNLCVLFSNPVGLNLLWSFNMWPFLNPPHNFSFHVTLHEPPHCISPAPLSSLCSVVFLWMEKRTQSCLGAGVRSHLEKGPMAEIWARSLLSVLLFFLLRYEADEQNHPRCPRLSAAGAPLISLSYTQMSLRLGRCVSYSLPRSVSAQVHCMASSVNPPVTHLSGH